MHDVKPNTIYKLKKIYPGEKHTHVYVLETFYWFNDDTAKTVRFRYLQNWDDYPTTIDMYDFLEIYELAK